MDLTSSINLPGEYIWPRRISRRDLFAAMVLQGAAKSCTVPMAKDHAPIVAEVAVIYADALLRALDAPTSNPPEDTL